MDDLTLISPQDDKELEKAKKALERIHEPGYFKVLSALARARRIPSNVLARQVEGNVAEIEKIKSDYLKEVNSVVDHAKDIKEVTESLAKIRFEDMKFELLDLVRQDMLSSAMDPKTKVDLLKFLHTETKEQKKAEDGKGRGKEDLTEKEFKERLQKLKEA